MALSMAKVGALGAMALFTLFSPVSARAQSAPATPQFAPGAGAAATAVEVGVTSATPGATVHFRFEEPNEIAPRDPEPTDAAVPASGRCR